MFIIKYITYLTLPTMICSLRFVWSTVHDSFNFVSCNIFCTILPIVHLGLGSEWGASWSLYIHVGYLGTSSTVRADTIHRLCWYCFPSPPLFPHFFFPFNAELRDQMKLLVLMLVLVSVTPARMAWKRLKTWFVLFPLSCVTTTRIFLGFNLNSQVGDG